MNLTAIRRKKFFSRLLWLLAVLFLLLLVVVAVFPFVYMAIVSLMENVMSMKLSANTLKKAVWSLNNYKKVLLTSNFARYLLNSVIVSGMSCLLSCLFSTMTAYAFSKKQFAGRDRLRGIFLATMMVPGECMIIPMYLIARKLGLVNTLAAMIIPLISSAFGTTMMYSFMKNVPDGLLEAADIDGCGELRKFFSIVFPLVKSAVVSLAIFIFISSWGSLLWPLLRTTKMELSTVTMAIARMSGGEKATNFGYVMAGNTLGFLPPFILYCFLQKQFVEGIALSGTKG